MQRTFFAIATLMILAASSAVALERKEAPAPQSQPDTELRSDYVSPGWSDSLTSAPTEDNSALAPGEGVGVWQPAVAE